MNNEIVFDEIRTREDKITDTEFKEKFLSDLLIYFDGKIRSLSVFVYGRDAGYLGVRAFQEYAKETLERGTLTFNVRYEYWREGRPLAPYLSRCLTRLAYNLKAEIDSQRKITVPVCPGCKARGKRTLCTVQSKDLVCPICSKAEDGRLSKIFASHSRKGYRCPDCQRFNPQSHLNGSYVSCIYDDCWWFGVMDEMERMTHPTTRVSESLLSLDDPIRNYTSDADGGGTYKDLMPISEVRPDTKLVFQEEFANDYNLVEQVLKRQMDSIGNKNPGRTIKKKLMYKAYLNMLQKDPEDMVKYLCHLQSRTDTPLQSRIFQEFIVLLENALPFKLFLNGCNHDIYTLIDPKLNIFSGISEFDSNVPENHIIRNNTREHYIGGRDGKDYGSNLIGKLENIINVETGESYKDKIKLYNFSSIHLDNSIPVGTKVKIIHLSIPSHYEIGGLVQLQRIRRKVVDSIYKRKHGERRPLRGEETTTLL